MSSAEPESGDCSGQGSTIEGTKLFNPRGGLESTGLPATWAQDIQERRLLFHMLN